MHLLIISCLLGLKVSLTEGARSSWSDGKCFNSDNAECMDGQTPLTISTSDHLWTITQDTSLHVCNTIMDSASPEKLFCEKGSVEVPCGLCFKRRFMDLWKYSWENRKIHLMRGLSHEHQSFIVVCSPTVFYICASLQAFLVLLILGFSSLRRWRGVIVNPYLDVALAVVIVSMTQVALFTTCHLSSDSG
uniref:Uncharacterized protein n=2 Tax=Usinis virus TaxID=2800948 RepID=A0A894KL66_9VIRU|nr:MAG: hypothetical protein 2 [Usinis virus]QRW42694.1 MAG: hypothetical protein 2 [Usinis virus]QRW42695.1 MAG: hypothetical protein 2 [Usinis virus]QRW42696.1 MAG: hypothetical protein 2 [Usinis virus]QRW42697.1 MAG: hypothetical protein 2 [Usinis virus]